jgi:hypothetical protein
VRESGRKSNQEAPPAITLFNKTGIMVGRGELEVREWRRKYLACLRTVRVKLDLLGSKFTSCVHIVAQIDPAESTLA